MKKTNKTNGQSANTIFAEAMVANPKQTKTKHTLGTFEEAIDKATEKATKKSLFDDMLSEQRGLNANCKLFAQYATDSRMMVVVRAKGLKVLPKDFAKVFTADFICDNLNDDSGIYRYNGKNEICKVTLAKTGKRVEEYTAKEYQTLTNKDGKTAYLVPMTRYTFEQFLTLAKCAINNYWTAIREAKTE